MHMADVDMPPMVADSTESAPAVPAGDLPGSQPAPVETTATDEQEQPQETPEQAEQRKQSRSQSRAFASQRRIIGDLQRTIGRLEERLSGVTAPPQQTQSGPPKQTDFNNFDDWLAARDQYLLTKAKEEFSEVVGRKVQPETDPAEKGTKFWKEAAKQAKELGLKDFDDAMEAIQTGEVVTSPAMSHYVVEDAENPAAVVAWLAENPDEAERISKLDPVKAGAAMAKVDARLGRKPRQVSAAPAPAPDLRGGGTVSPSLERMSHDDLTRLVGKWNRA
jgi:hypothetical protein